MNRNRASAPGACADITVIDPDFEWTVDPAKFISMSRNTPFTGRKLKGRAIYTIVSGEIVHGANASHGLNPVAD